MKTPFAQLLLLVICTLLAYSVADTCQMGYMRLGEVQNLTCIPCPQGHYCDAINTVYPKRCPAATYNPVPMSTSIESCISCRDSTTSIAGAQFVSDCQPASVIPIKADPEAKTYRRILFDTGNGNAQRDGTIGTATWKPGSAFEHSGQKDRFFMSVLDTIGDRMRYLDTETSYLGTIRFETTSPYKPAIRRFATVRIANTTHFLASDQTKAYYRGTLVEEGGLPVIRFTSRLGNGVSAPTGVASTDDGCNENAKAQNDAVKIDRICSSDLGIERYYVIEKMGSVELIRQIDANNTHICIKTLQKWTIITSTIFELHSLFCHNGYLIVTTKRRASAMPIYLPSIYSIDLYSASPAWGDIMNTGMTLPNYDGTDHVECMFNTRVCFTGSTDFTTVDRVVKTAHYSIASSMFSWNADVRKSYVKADELVVSSINQIARKDIYLLPLLYEPCPVNFYQPIDLVPMAYYCLPCPERHVCMTGSHSLDDCTWELCPKGSYYRTDPADNICVECPPGHFCNEQQPESRYPGRCPANTYNPLSNSSDVSACLPCPDGYVSVPGSRFISDCQRSYPTPIAVTQPYSRNILLSSASSGYTDGVNGEAEFSTPAALGMGYNKETIYMVHEDNGEFLRVVHATTSEVQTMWHSHGLYNLTSSTRIAFSVNNASIYHHVLVSDQNTYLAGTVQNEVNVYGNYSFRFDYKLGRLDSPSPTNDLSMDDGCDENVSIGTPKSITGSDLPGLDQFYTLETWQISNPELSVFDVVRRVDIIGSHICVATLFRYPRSNGGKLNGILYQNGYFLVSLTQSSSSETRIYFIDLHSLTPNWDDLLDSSKGLLLPRSFANMQAMDCVYNTRICMFARTMLIIYDRVLDGTRTADCGGTCFLQAKTAKFASNGPGYRFVVADKRSVSGITNIYYKDISSGVCTENTYLYSDSDGSLCLQCPEYTVSPSNSVGIQSCVCVAQRQGPNGGPCLPCPEHSTKETSGEHLCSCNTGYYGPDGELCQACPLGSSKQGVGDHPCLCDPGYYGPDGGPCEVCPSGSSKHVVGDTLCVCDPGYYGPDGGPCQECSVGTYKTTSGTHTCTSCPVHKTTRNNGSITAEDCECDVAYTGMNGIETCLPCPPTTYKNVSGSSECVSCLALQTSVSASTVCVDWSTCGEGLPQRYVDSTCPCPVGTRYINRTNLSWTHSFDFERDPGNLFHEAYYDPRQLTFMDKRGRYRNPGGELTSNVYALAYASFGSQSPNHLWNIGSNKRGSFIGTTSEGMFITAGDGSAAYNDYSAWCLIPYADLAQFYDGGMHYFQWVILPSSNRLGVWIDNIMVCNASAVSMMGLPPSLSSCASADGEDWGTCTSSVPNGGVCNSWDGLTVSINFHYGVAASDVISFQENLTPRSVTQSWHGLASLYVHNNFYLPDLQRQNLLHSPPFRIQTGSGSAWTVDCFVWQSSQYIQEASRIITTRYTYATSSSIAVRKDFYIFRSSGQLYMRGNEIADSLKIALEADVWHRFTLKINPDTVSWYINGSHFTTMTRTVISPVITEHFITIHYFGGYIDNLRIYGYEIGDISNILDECEEINECVEGTHTCNAVGSGCVDTYGSFYCVCNIGYLQIDPSPVCVPCPKGYYCDTVNDIQPSQCPDHSNTSDTGAVSMTECLCNPGYTGPDGGPCTVCLTGTYKSGLGTHQCTMCPPNSLTARVGSTTASDCLCKTGFTGPDGGPCIACIVGKYKDINGSVACTTCPSLSGTVSGATTEIGGCICNVGTSGPNGGPCSICPSQTYKGIRGSSACVLCPTELPMSNPGSSNVSQCFDASSCFASAGCVCVAGYHHTTNGALPCQDINECSTNTHGCDTLRSVCKNYMGYYQCECPWRNTGGINSTCNPCLQSERYLVNMDTCEPCPGARSLWHTTLVGTADSDMNNTCILHCLNGAQQTRFFSDEEIFNVSNPFCSVSISNSLTLMSPGITMDHTSFNATDGGLSSLQGRFFCGHLRHIIPFVAYAGLGHDASNALQTPYNNPCRHYNTGTGGVCLLRLQEIAALPSDFEAENLINNAEIRAWLESNIQQRETSRLLQVETKLPIVVSTEGVVLELEWNTADYMQGSVEITFDTGRLLSTARETDEVLTNREAHIWTCDRKHALLYTLSCRMTFGFVMLGPPTSHIDQEPIISAFGVHVQIQENSLAILSTEQERTCLQSVEVAFFRYGTSDHRLKVDMLIPKHMSTHIAGMHNEWLSNNASLIQRAVELRIAMASEKGEPYQTSVVPQSKIETILVYNPPIDSNWPAIISVLVKLDSAYNPYFTNINDPQYESVPGPLLYMEASLRIPNSVQKNQSTSLYGNSEPYYTRPFACVDHVTMQFDARRMGVINLVKADVMQLQGVNLWVCQGAHASAQYWERIGNFSGMEQNFIRHQITNEEHSIAGPASMLAFASTGLLSQGRGWRYLAVAQIREGLQQDEIVQSLSMLTEIVDVRKRFQRLQETCIVEYGINHCIWAEIIADNFLLTPERILVPQDPTTLCDPRQPLWNSTRIRLIQLMSNPMDSEPGEDENENNEWLYSIVNRYLTDACQFGTLSAEEIMFISIPPPPWKAVSPLKSISMRNKLMIFTGIETRSG